MKTRLKKTRVVAKKKVAPDKRRASITPGGRFDEVLALIEAARRRAFQAVNAELVGLYWELGAYISRKLRRSFSDEIFFSRLSLS